MVPATQRATPATRSARPPLGVVIPLHRPLSEVSVILAKGSAAGDPTERYDQRFLAAVRAYQRESWQLAFAQFSALADQGSTPAAKLTLLMLRYGRPVYGTDFVVAPGRVALWAKRVLRSTR